MKVYEDSSVLAPAEELAALLEQSLNELQSLLTQIKTEHADNDRIKRHPREWRTGEIRYTCP